MSKVSLGALLAPVDDNRVLMIRRRFFIPEWDVPERYAGEWTFAGGHVERGESFRGAAHREFFEETGYTGEILASSLLMRVTPDIYGRKYDVRFYEAMLADLPGVFEPGPEVIDVRWWDVDSIRDYMTSEEFERDLLCEYEMRGLGDSKYGSRKMDRRHFPHQTYKALEVLKNGG